jgi:hypothetical protein
MHCFALHRAWNDLATFIASATLFHRHVMDQEGRPADGPRR